MRSPSTDPTVDRPARPGRSFTIASPYFALAALFSMNLLNYVDRYVFYSAGPKICLELRFDDPAFSQLSVSFMIVYTIASPLVGWLGDRYNRKRILAFGVALWSVATVGTAFAQGFADMFFWRALLGIGEASYGIIAPALLADLFAPKHRGRVIGLYYLALPVGGAIGYLIGGHFAHVGNWRGAFWVVGLPGLAAAVAGLILRDPGRGASEGAGGVSNAARPGAGDYLAILKTPSFLLNTLGQAAVTFAIGAYAVWGATFYSRVRGMDFAAAGKQIGVVTAVAALLGIGVGTWITELLRKSSRRAYLLWSFLAVAIAVPFATLALLETQTSRSLVFLFVASLMMASVLGASNTVTANVVPAGHRAAGFALSIFMVHLFGDISSPWLIGELSKFLGGPETAAGPLGQFFASIGATPTTDAKGLPSNLTAGMLAVVPMLALGSVLFLLGSITLPRDEERARLAGGGDGPVSGVFVH